MPVSGATTCRSTELQMRRRLANMRRKTYRKEVENRVIGVEATLNSYLNKVKRVRNLNNEQWREIIREDFRYRELLRSLNENARVMHSAAKELEDQLKEVRRDRN